MNIHSRTIHASQDNVWIENCDSNIGKIEPLHRAKFQQKIPLAFWLRNIVNFLHIWSLFSAWINLHRWSFLPFSFYSIALFSHCWYKIWFAFLRFPFCSHFGLPVVFAFPAFLLFLPFGFFPQCGTNGNPAVFLLGVKYQMLPNAFCKKR